MSTNEDSVRIQISKDSGEGGDGGPSLPQLQTTLGSSSVSSAQATNFLKAQMSSLSSKSINIFRRQVTYRELIFTGIVAAFLITSLALMIVVIEDDKALAYEKKMVTCTDYDCYTNSAVMQRKVNKTYSPCDNFYKYACAQWTESQMLSGVQEERTLLTELETENAKRVNNAIMRDIDPMRNTYWAYEGKLQKMYKTCLNQYQTTNYFDNNNPVINEIVKMGGWYLFGNDNYTEFRWTKAHRDGLNRDNLAQAFFFWDVESWNEQHSIYKITIRQDLFLALPYNMWNVLGTDYKSMYRAMLEKVARMFAEDAGITDAGVSGRVSQFATDVLKIEESLAKIQMDNVDEISANQYRREFLSTLPSLGLVRDGFSWVSFFNATLYESPVDIGLGTEVFSFTPKILEKTASDLRAYNSREFNNFLTWRLIYSYLGDMSYEYNHVLLEWADTLKGDDFANEYKPSWVSCLERAQAYMGDAVDGVYVRHNFNSLDKGEIDYLSETIRSTVIDKVNQLDWMDDETKIIAVEKIGVVIEKLGYPDFMDTQLSTQNMLDYEYMNVNMSTVDNFQNVQQLRQHYRLKYVNMFAFGLDPMADWRTIPLYSVRSTYFYPWNEMIFPAGLLQFPIFSANNPIMYRMQTYGSIGVRLGRGFLYAVGEYGQWYDKDGNMLGASWWSEETSKNYYERKKCFSDWYSEVETDPIDHDGLTKKIKLSDPKLYAIQSVIDVGALRYAFATYTSSKVQSDAVTARERFLPGVEAKSKEEYFFLSFAQTQCAIRSDDLTYTLMKSSTWLPEELAVNNILKNMQEFSDVFKCPSNSEMNQQTGCKLF